MFKPSRADRPLRADDQTWEEALADFELTASQRVRHYIANIDAIGASAKAGQELAKKRREKLAAGELQGMTEDLAAFGAGGSVDLDDDGRPDGVDDILAIEWGDGDDFTEDQRLDSFRSKIRLLRPSTGVHDAKGLIAKTNAIARLNKLFDAAPGRSDGPPVRPTGRPDLLRRITGAGKTLLERRTAVLAATIAAGEKQSQIALSPRSGPSTTPCAGYSAGPFAHYRPYCRNDDSAVDAPPGASVPDCCRYIAC